MANRLNVSRVWGSADPVSSIIDMGEEKYLTGWVAEIPAFQHLNFLQYRVDTNLRALAERGLFEWGSDVGYIKGALAWDELDGGVYVADVADPDTALAPSLNSAQWTKSSLQLTEGQFNDLVAALATHEANTANPHKTTAHQVGTLTAEEIDNLLAGLGADLTQHENNKANPHGVTADQAGAVPITGGAYTGVVDFLQGRVQINKGSTPSPAYVDALSGIFLTMGQYAIGINAAGTAVWKDGSTESALLYTNQFDSLKEQVEPEYSVPKSDFWMPLVSDANIYRGFGGGSYSGAAGIPYTNKGGSQVTTELDELPFTKDGYYMGEDTAQVLVVDSIANLAGFPQYTIAFDFTVYDLAIPGDRFFFIANSANQGELLFWLDSADQGAVHFRVAGSQPTIGKVVQGVTSRFCLTRDGGVIKVYQDGVLKGTYNYTPSALDITGTEMDIGAYHFDMAFKNLRVWAGVLTDRQVAGL